jgi:hypothetical protein
MSLYRHVENKEDILNGLVDLVVAEIELPTSEGGWRPQMRRRAISARRVFARHRWAIGLVESRTQPGAATLRHHEAVLATLIESGFSGFMAAQAYNLLDSYIYGFALQEASLPYDDPEGQAQLGQAMLQQLPADEYPNLVRVTREFLESGADLAAFEFGLDLVLDGIERVSPRQSRQPGTRSSPSRIDVTTSLIDRAGGRPSSDGTLHDEPEQQRRDDRDQHQG